MRCIMTMVDGDVREKKFLLVLVRIINGRVSVALGAMMTVQRAKTVGGKDAQEERSRGYTLKTVADVRVLAKEPPSVDESSSDSFTR